MLVLNGMLSCRICLEEGSRNDFIAPCACSGTSKWVHRSCLDRWRSIREDKAFSSCTECLRPYKLVCITPEDSAKCYRKIRFACYICHDFSLVFVVSNCAVVLLGLFSYLIDESSGRNLIALFKMGGLPVIFYYLVGLILSLAFIGMFFSCMPRADAQQNGDIICCSGCDGMYFYPYPYAATTATDSTTCCCCPGECGGCHAGNIACCECGECASAGAVGEEAFICLIGVMIIFAVIGVFYCLGMGAYYLQYVTQRHLHVLGKMNLTREYIVEDLAEGAIPVTCSGGTTSLIDVDHFSDVESGMHSTTSVEQEGAGGGIELRDTTGSSWSGNRGYARIDTSDSDGGGDLSSHLLAVAGPSIIQPTASTPPSESNRSSFLQQPVEQSSLSRRHKDELTRLGLM